VNLPSKQGFVGAAILLNVRNVPDVYYFRRTHHFPIYASA